MVILRLGKAGRCEFPAGTGGGKQVPRESRRSRRQNGMAESNPDPNRQPWGRAVFSAAPFARWNEDVEAAPLRATDSFAPFRQRFFGAG